MTQCEMILDYMDRFGSISPLDAFADLGVMRLASRICDLRKSGVAIVDSTVTAKNRFGQTVRFKVYRRA